MRLRIFMIQLGSYAFLLAYVCSQIYLLFCFAVFELWSHN